MDAGKASYESAHLDERDPEKKMATEPPPTTTAAAATGNPAASDVEKDERVVPERPGFEGKTDPFGDESNSEVKYKTMAWW